MFRNSKLTLLLYFFMESVADNRGDEGEEVPRTLLGGGGLNV